MMLFRILQKTYFYLLLARCLSVKKQEFFFKKWVISKFIFSIKFFCDISKCMLKNTDGNMVCDVFPKTCGNLYCVQWNKKALDLWKVLLCLTWQTFIMRHNKYWKTWNIQCIVEHFYTFQMLKLHVSIHKV